MIYQPMFQMQTWTAGHTAFLPQGASRVRLSFTGRSTATASDKAS